MIVEVSDEVGNFAVVQFLRGLQRYSYTAKLSGNFGEVLGKAKDEGKQSKTMIGSPMDWEALG